MSDYTRGKIWSDGESLSAQDLNDEFDRIQSVLNGGLGLDNFQSGEIETPLVINAGAPRFDTGGLERAERIANAVSEAVGSDIKVVWVPRSMWGYVADATYASSIFDTGVLMVREGQLHPGHDPIAYGAIPDDAAIDDTPAFSQANTGAVASAAAANPGAQFVVVSLPGEYQLDSSPSHDATVGFLKYPGVTFAGAGTPPSVGAWAFENLLHREDVVDFGTTTIAAGTTAALSKNLVRDPANWIPLTVRVDVEDIDAGTTHNFYAYGSDGDGTTNFDFVMDLIKDGGAGEFNVVLEAFNKDSSGHTLDAQVTIWFLRKTIH